MIERFGKSFGDLLPFKTHFFESNRSLLARVQEVAAEYARQPPRTVCKNCDGALHSRREFTKHGVTYLVCARCGHCCGAWQETDRFLQFLYAADGGQTYAAFYSAADVDAYHRRVQAIYAPKVAFLADVLRANRDEPESLQVADLGAGSGYMVAAFRQAGITAQGYDVSQAQADFAERVVGNRPVICHRIEDAVDLAAHVAADVVSMVGFIEHIPEPHRLMAALRANRQVRYLLMTFPLLSPTVFIEQAFPDVFPRHLGGAHTHIFTLESLRWFEERHGLRPLGKWWFGTDMLDLCRSLTVSLAAGGDEASATELMTLLRPELDGWQLAVDRARKSSSVHAVYAVDRE